MSELDVEGTPLGAENKACLSINPGNPEFETKERSTAIFAERNQWHGNNAWRTFSGDYSFPARCVTWLRDMRGMQHGVTAYQFAFHQEQVDQAFQADGNVRDLFFILFAGIE